MKQDDKDTITTKCASSGFSRPTSRRAALRQEAFAPACSSLQLPFLGYGHPPS